MGHHKLMLDDDFKEEFSLLAVHCSEEAYKVAYLLNKHLGLRLKREEIDLDYSNNGLGATFPLFQFKNNLQYTTYNLVANKCKSIVGVIESSGGLFGNDASEKFTTTYLLPEYKKVDFFFKIFSEFETIPLRKIIANINEIKEVISAYEVETENLKSKTNLIFD
jgi:hypothetical protein